MKRIIILACIIAIMLFLLWGGFVLLTRKVEKELEFPLTPVSGKDLPRFNDDLNGDGLKRAVALHIKRMEGKNLDKRVRLGALIVTQKRILETLQRFSQLIEEKGTASLHKEIPKYFLVFQTSGLNGKGDVLYTGYYQPELEARKESGDGFQYPIYATPHDLQILDLGEFNPEYAGQKIGLRVEAGKIKPYYDRKAIDEDMVLAGKGLELVYLKDFMDRYFLHIQGSGLMKLENNQNMTIRYASSNCFPYVSLGRLLVEDQKIPPEKISLRAIRQYYQEHPEEMQRYLNRNPRYIFFEEVPGNVTGSEGVELTPGRSIATDKSLFPGGGLAFIVCRKPNRNAKGEVTHWTPMRRFMVDQDTGAAMKGPGRVDIFWGTGKEAEKIAGGFKEMGKLYYLLIKRK